MSNLVIAVLGSDGFIGSHVSQSCVKSGMPVFGLQKWDGNRENFIDQIHELKQANPDSQIVLVQAAWYSTSNVDYRTSKENLKWIETTKSILRVCIENQVTFVGLGTCLEKLQTEDDLYASSKSKIQNYLSKEFLSEDWIWFQLHYVYSLEYLKPAVLKKAAEAVEAGIPLKLATPNDKHDFIEVRDVAEAIVHSIITGQRGKLEIGIGSTVEVSILLKSLFPKLEITEEVSTEKRISYQGAASVERLVKSGWSPKFSFR